MTEIRLEHIAKRYDNGFEAVKELSLCLPAGSFTVLLGPSGCGKTTTLRMIAGLETISSGNLYFDNERMNDAPPKDRDIGMVFQNYALYPHLTVFENIAFPLRLRKIAQKELEERVQSAAATVELGHLLDRKPKQLSGGQRQRVALARAIVRKPRVFLFDEPLSNLDAQLRQQMRAEITRLQRLVGATAVYVTHDQSEAMTMADNIVILHEGKLQQVGTPQEIYANPINRFVAGFVGSPAINFFKGEVRENSGTITFHEYGASAGITIPSSLFTAQKLPTGKCTLAIRPEHLFFTEMRSSGGSMAEMLSFSATVQREEFLGHEHLVYVQTTPNQPTIVIRLAVGGNVPETGMQIGSEVNLFALTHHCCFFDESGKRIVVGESRGEFLTE